MSTEKILEGYSDMEKGAYLGAIASIATADRQATEEELSHLEALCDAAGLSAEQKQTIVAAADELTGEDLTRCLDILKNSELRYSLLADLMAFAKADQDYSEAEAASIHKIADYLGVNREQYEALDQFAEKAAEEGVAQEGGANPSFLSSSPLGSKLQHAGINTGSLFKGILAMAAPMLLSGMLSRGLGRRGGGGGLMGGLGGMLGGGGGLGSLIGMLSGGRGMRGAGGLLGRILGGGRF